MSFTSAIRSEFAKVLTLRPTVCTAVSTAVVTIVVAAGLTALVQRAVSLGHPEDAGGLESASAFLVILHYSQIGFILLGSWLMLEEQDNGSLRTSFLATPSRLTVFSAKAFVVFVGCLIVAVISVLGSYAVSRVVGAEVTITRGGIHDARILFGLIAYLSLIGVLSFALSALVRNGLVGLGLMLALVLALSQYLGILTPLARFLPDQAGAQIYQQHAPSEPDLGPALGLAVLILWVVLALAGGALSFRRWAVRR